MNKRPEEPEVKLEKEPVAEMAIEEVAIVPKVIPVAASIEVYAEAVAELAPVPLALTAWT